MVLNHVVKASIALATIALVGCSSGGGSNSSDPRGGNQNTGKTGKDQQTNPNSPSNPGDQNPNGPTVTFSCHFTNEAFCNEVVAPQNANDGIEEYKKDCTNDGNRFVMGACPNAGHVATCTYTVQDGYSSKIRFYAPMDYNQAVQVCQAGGGKLSTQY